MKTSHIIAVIILALIAGMVGASVITSGNKTSVKAETAAERVLRTGVLRCGYPSWAPMVIVDGNTKEISGIAHDVIEAIAKKIDVKVQWTEESGWGEFAQSLNTNRFDVYCSGLFSNVQRERVIDFTQPFTYSRMAIWTQERNDKFDNKVASLNDPATRLVFVDGTTAAALTQRQFPKAHVVSLPELTPISNIFQELSAHKADAGVMEVASAADFMTKNPGKIKLVVGSDGYQVFPNKFAVANGEYALQQLLNTAIEELNSEGIIEDILAKYEPLPGSYYRMAKPYQAVRGMK